MHQRAQLVFAQVMAEVHDDDLATATPCSDWTVADLLDHVLDGDRTAVQRMGAVPSPAKDADRMAVHRTAADDANAVVSTPGWQQRFVELPFGSVPAPVFASIRSGDLYVHAWDLATALGADVDLDHDLGEAIFAATAPVLSPDLRGPGRPFGAERLCDPDRPIADRMAAFLGREV